VQSNWHRGRAASLKAKRDVCSAIRLSQDGPLGRGNNWRQTGGEGGVHARHQKGVQEQIKVTRAGAYPKKNTAPSGGRQAAGGNQPRKRGVQVGDVKVSAQGEDKTHEKNFSQGFQKGKGAKRACWLGEFPPKSPCHPWYGLSGNEEVSGWTAEVSRGSKLAAWAESRRSGCGKKKERVSETQEGYDQKN